MEKDAGPAKVRHYSNNVKMIRLKDIAESLLYIIFPEKCLLCGKTGKHLCSECRAKIKYPASAEMPPCEGADILVSCSLYEGIIKKLIRKLKFSGKRAAAPIIGEIMAYQLTRIKEMKLCDCIVPIPLHKERLAERGFSQTLLIASELSARTGLQVSSGMLKKTVNTPFMYKLDRKSRKKNAAGTFLAAEEAAGRKILLIDDIYTTGATMSEAAKELKRKGASFIFAAAAARAL